MTNATAFIVRDGALVEVEQCPDRWCRLPRLNLKRWHTDQRKRDDCAPEFGLDRCGRKRSRATSPEFRRGLKPANAGLTYPATPYTDAEVLALMDACPDTRAWRRMRALIALLWRSGLRISEALALLPADLDPEQGTVTVQCGKGGKRRISAMDQFGWEQIEPWLAERPELPSGPVFCIVEGPTKGERWTPAGVRQGFRKLRDATGLEKRLAPHQLRHSHAIGLVKDGVLLPMVSRQLGHSNIATTSTYLSGISPQEVIDAVMARPMPGGIQ